MSDDPGGPSEAPVAASEKLERAGQRQVLLVGGSLLFILAAFWPTLLSYGSVWDRYTYSHGYATALLTLWLLWRRRDALLDGRPYWAAAIPLVGLSLTWVAATVMNIQVVHQGVLPLILVAWAATVAGPKAARRFAPGLVIFLFAVPFWEVLIPPLQALTIKVSGGIAGGLGIPATIRGEFITTPAGTFHVERGCAGLAFFIIGVLIATLYAHLFLERWKTRIEVVALGGAIGIVGNWVRVTGVVLIGYATELKSPLIRHHGITGWVIFAVGFLFVFFPVAQRLGKGERGRGAGGPALGRPGLSPASGRAGVALPELVLATALAVVGPLAYFGIAALPAAPPETAPLRPPPAAWRELPASHPRPFDWSPDFRDPDVTQTTGWTNGSKEVYRERLLYREERQGRELVGGGNRIAPPAKLLADGTIWLRAEDLWVRQAAVVEPDDRVVLVWYWYRVGGVRAVSPGWAKVLELWAFLRRRQNSQVVSVSTLCHEDDCGDGVATLRDFIQ